MDSSFPSGNKVGTGNPPKTVTFASNLTTADAASSSTSSSTSSSGANNPNHHHHPSLSIAAITESRGGTILHLSSTNTVTRIPKRKKAKWFRPTRDAFDDDDNEDGNTEENNLPPESSYVEEIILSSKSSKSSPYKRKRRSKLQEEGDDEGSDNEDNDDDDGNEEEEAGSGVPLQSLGSKHNRDDDDEEEEETNGNEDDDENETRTRSTKTKIKALKKVWGEHQYNAKDKEINDTDNAVPIVPFHLQSERDEGYYNAEGEYVWKKKEDEDEEDAWLAAIDEQKGGAGNQGMKDNEDKAKKQPKGRNGWDNVDEEEDSSSSGSSTDEDDEDNKEEELFQRARALYTLYKLLHDSETVVQALRRFGKQISTANKTTNNTTNSTTTVSSVLSSGNRKPNNQFNRLTEAVDLLVSTGMTDAYTLTRGQAKFELGDTLEEMDMDEDEFIRTREEEEEEENEKGIGNEEGKGTGTENNNNSSSSTIGVTTAGYYLPPEGTWEYRWTDPGAILRTNNDESSVPVSSDTVYGPFTSDQMNQWIGVGYFATVIPYVRLIKGNNNGNIQQTTDTSEWFRLDQRK